MKPFFTKALDAVTFGQLRRRTATTTTTTTSSPSEGINGFGSVVSSRYSEHPDKDWSVYCKSSSSEEISNQEDDVVLCKNNVYLKYPNRRSRNQSGESFSDSISTNSSGNSSVPDTTGNNSTGIPLKPLPSAAQQQPRDQDSHILVPGYFHISTRGSDFGQTLIMNWSPNSLISQVDPSPLPSSLPSTLPSADATTNYNKPSVSSISIDLSQMESIRIFYQNDPFDPVTGGEVVICTRERRFKIFIFKHGGLNDLIKKFCSWKYFNYQHQAAAHQYLFTVFRPRLSLSELHPEEGLINGVLTEHWWGQLKDHTGKVIDKKMVLQVI